jgi:hypothetical protein
MSIDASAAALFQDFNDCLEKPLSSVALRRIFTSLLKVHWGDAHNFGEYEETLGCLVYDDDPAASKLTILPAYVFDAEKTENFPGIFVGLGINYKKTSLDNFAGQGEDLSDTYYSTLANVAMTISHVHRSADLAFSMAESTTAFLLGLRKPIMNRIGLMEMEPRGLSEAQPIQSKPERFFEVDLTINLTFNLGMTVNLESHRLKKFASYLTPQV